MNHRPGATSAKTNSGASLQGSLSVRGGELQFLGGGVHQQARYDLATGKCLNEPNDLPRSFFATAFYAYFPTYGKYMSLGCDLADGKSLRYSAAYEGTRHSRLMLVPTTPPGRDGARRTGQQVEPIWQRPADWRLNGFVVADNALLAAGHTGPSGTDNSFLTAIKIEDGAELWRERLPGPVVKGGAAVNHRGQIFVSLESGQMVAFAARD